MLLASVAVGRAADESSVGQAGTDQISAVTEPKESAAGGRDVAEPAQASAKDLPPALKEALEGFERTRQAIASYDVRLSVTVTFPMKTILVKKEKIDPRRPNVVEEYQWRPLDPGVEPTTTESTFRQVRSRDGKRRVETDRQRDGRHDISVAVDDGQVVRIRNSDKEGTTRTSIGFRLPEPEEYRYYLGDLMATVPIRALMTERPGTRLIEEKMPDPNLVGIELPAGQGRSLRQFGFGVWLDRRHGFMPAKIETYFLQDQQLVLSSRLLVRKFHEPQPGVWVPIEMTQTNFNKQPGEYLGRAVNLYRAEVDVDKSRWNGELDPGVFLLPFAAGTHVMDFVNNLDITAGPGDDGQGVQALIQGAEKTRPINTPATMRSQQADLDKVRPEDLEAAKVLRTYGALLKANAEGAITSLDFVGMPGRIDSPNIDDDGLQYVARLSKLEHLSLNRTRITDRGLAHLRGLVNLKVLSLSNTKITDEGVKQLETLTNLEWLFLENYVYRENELVRTLDITDKALQELQPLKKLTHLQIRGTGITDAGLEYLEKLPNLQQVSLGSTKITPAGLQKLKRDRPALRGLPE